MPNEGEATPGPGHPDYQGKPDQADEPQLDIVQGLWDSMTDAGKTVDPFFGRDPTDPSSLPPPSVRPVDPELDSLSREELMELALNRQVEHIRAVDAAEAGKMSEVDLKEIADKTEYTLTMLTEDELRIIDDRTQAALEQDDVENT